MVIFLLAPISTWMMPRAYSNDLWWRIVWRKLLFNQSDEDVVVELLVCPKTVNRIYNLFLNTGDVLAANIGRPKETIALYPHEEYLIVDTILRKPTVQLAENRRDIEQNFGTHLSFPNLCLAIHRLGFTRRKQVLVFWLGLWFMPYTFLAFKIEALF